MVHAVEIVLDKNEILWFYFCFSNNTSVIQAGIEPHRVCILDMDSVWHFVLKGRISVGTASHTFSHNPQIVLQLDWPWSLSRTNRANPENIVRIIRAHCNNCIFILGAIKGTRRRRRFEAKNVLHRIIIHDCVLARPQPAQGSTPLLHKLQKYPECNQSETETSQLWTMASFFLREVWVNWENQVMQI